MSRHKYFEDIEDINNNKVQHPSKYCSLSDKRSESWFKERRKYGFDSRETWNLDSVFYIWLYEHLMMYKEKAENVINLNYHTFEYKGETLTQLQCIDKMIEGCKLYIQDCETQDKEKIEKINSVCEILGLVIRYMWW